MRLSSRTCLSGFTLVALAIGIWFALLPLSAPDASAAPLSGGQLTVDTDADNNTYDDYLSLREALLLIQGGTASFGVNRVLKDGERNMISGTCASIGGNHNSWSVSMSGCLSETVNFSLTIGTVIGLNSALPLIQWSSPTTIDGTGVGPAIDMSSIGPNSYGLAVYSSGHTIRNIGVVGNAPGSWSNFYVAGNNNTFVNDWAWNGDGDGFSIIGSSNLISGTRIGVFAPMSNSCGTGNLFKGNARYGIYLATGAMNNTISYNYIGCNGYDAVYVAPNAGVNNTIGPNNVIGTNSARTANLGNGGSGVVLKTSSNNVLTNTLAFGFHGVYVSSNSNLIAGNTIISNTVNGINLYSTASSNTIGCTSPSCSSGAPNQISGNSKYGLNLSGANVVDNSVVGNDIGASNRYVTAGGNIKGGVWIESGSHGNTIQSNTINMNHASGVVITGTTTAMHILGSNLIQGNDADGVVIHGASAIILGSIAGPNTISGNGSNGVVIENGAHDNTLWSNSIGTLTEGNGGNGVLVQLNAHDNTLHANDIMSNVYSGVFIMDAGTFSNTLDLNTIYGNVGNGITLAHGTYSNTIGGPQSMYGNNIQANGQQGIGLYEGTHNNWITFNSVRSNNKNGIELSDPGTLDNSISYSGIFDNGKDGINERNSATYNSWIYSPIYHNGGLGIDKDAPNDNQDVPTMPYPVITSIQRVGSNVKFTGTGSPSFLGTQNVLVQIFRAAKDPSGFGEGDQFFQNAYTTSNGTWTWAGPAFLTGCYTAVQTVQLSSGRWTSSEFGPAFCFNLYLPLILR